MTTDPKGKNYKVMALFPVLIFVGLYIGTGAVFTVTGADEPFSMMPRYAAILFSILAALICFEPKRSMTEKVEIYCEKAGKKSVMLLGLIVMMAGGFSSAAEAIGGKESLVNISIKLIPTHFLVPGIFVICAIISTCIGTSIGTLVTMIPIAFSLAEGTGLDIGMTGAAVITGSYFGDNLSMISDTTICATKGVGAEMKDKFRVNFKVAFPAAIITTILYILLSLHTSVLPVEAGQFQITAIIPYFAVLILAVMGMDVVAVLTMGILLCCAIGVLSGKITFFGWAQAVSTGMEEMFWLAVFTTLVSGLVGLVDYYGGIAWLVHTIASKIKNRRGCECIIGLLSMLISGVIVNNTMAIIITAPVAKKLGTRYEVLPGRMASLLDIGACIAVMIVPHGSGIMMVQEVSESSYLDILKFQFYPFVLILCTVAMIWLKQAKGKEAKRNE